jgi:hypothetical protein
MGASSYYFDSERKKVLACDSITELSQKPHSSGRPPQPPLWGGLTTMSMSRPRRSCPYTRFPNSTSGANSGTILYMANLEKLLEQMRLEPANVSFSQAV